MNVKKGKIVVMKKIAIYGGSFDPPHIGHLAVIEEAVKNLEIDKLIVIPTFLNPFKTLFMHLQMRGLDSLKELFGQVPKRLDRMDYGIKEGKGGTPTVRTRRYFRKELFRVYIFIYWGPGLILGS